MRPEDRPFLAAMALLSAIAVAVIGIGLFAQAH
jgi:hypothetical protein